MENVVFDLDDMAFQKERNCEKQLFYLKDKFPNLKVTLFAIPMYGGIDQSNYFKTLLTGNRDWIQLGIHGWDHHDNFECSQWNYIVAAKKIWDAYNMGCFEKLFKAPGWQISRDTYSVCKNGGFIVADHKYSAYTEPNVPNKERRPKSLRVYEIDHPWMVHGHTWNCVGNGVEELIEKWEKEGYPWDENTKFHFVTEMA